ncbi:MAG: holin family protein [Sphingomonadaceae bacterium]
MAILEAIIGPVTKIIDKVIPDPEARDRAKLELIKLEGTREMEMLETRLSAIISESNSTDPWTSRARPSFLYVVYAMILWALPMGMIGAFSPATASAIATGMNSYLNGLPEPLYALFGTGYLGYAVVRQWGKTKGTDR